jgi:hypothetical protein
MISRYARCLIFVFLALGLSVLAIPTRGIRIRAAATGQGCGAATPWTFDTKNHSNQTIGDRSFLVHIPAKYNSNTTHPVVFSFHGYGEDDLKQERISGFSREGNWIDSKVAIRTIVFVPSLPG